jgi:hypothetical protein
MAAGSAKSEIPCITNGVFAKILSDLPLACELAVEACGQYICEISFIVQLSIDAAVDIRHDAGYGSEIQVFVGFPDGTAMGQTAILCQPEDFTHRDEFIRIAKLDAPRVACAEAKITLWLFQLDGFEGVWGHATVRAVQVGKVEILTISSEDNSLVTEFGIRDAEDAVAFLPWL